MQKFDNTMNFSGELSKHTGMYPTHLGGMAASQGTLMCKACGAPVHEHEDACTYCLTAPDRPVQYIDCTRLEDSAPRLIAVRQPAYTVR